MLLLAFFVYSFVGVSAKYAALSGISTTMFLYIGLEVALLGTYALIWQQALKEISLVKAMAFKGTVVVLSMAWAVLFFNEKIAANHVVGSLVIIIGIWVVSQSE